MGLQVVNRATDRHGPSLLDQLRSLGVVCKAASAWYRRCVSQKGGRVSGCVQLALGSLGFFQGVSWRRWTCVPIDNPAKKKKKSLGRLTPTAVALKLVEKQQFFHTFTRVRAAVCRKSLDRIERDGQWCRWERLLPPGTKLTRRLFSFGGKLSFLCALHMHHL